MTHKVYWNKLKSIYDLSNIDLIYIIKLHDKIKIFISSYNNHYKEINYQTNDTKIEHNYSWNNKIKIGKT